MKKFIRTIIFLILAVVCFTGCAAVQAFNKDNPTSVTESFFEAIKTQDIKTIAKIYSGDSESLKIDNWGYLVNEKFSAKTNKAIFSKLLEFTYVAENEVITEPAEGEKGKTTATVEITLTTINLGNVINEALKNYFSTLSVEAAGISSEEEVKKLEKETKDAAVAAPGDYEAKFTVNLTKKGEKWRIDKFEDAGSFFNGIQGNATSTVVAPPPGSKTESEN